MTLRARLLLATGLILLVTSVGAVVILRTQQAFLIDQLDDQLSATRPLFPGPQFGDRIEPSAEAADRPDAPISNLYIGAIEDGQLVTILQGQLLDDVPDIDVDELDLTDQDSREPFSIDGSGSTRFRVVVQQPNSAGLTLVIALPLDEVNSAVGRLRWALAVGTAAITSVLLLAVWWVERLGLRPVARVTAVADAIAGGDRGRRVEGATPRTEAGRLATAFNVMLDERDADEERLRRFVADASHELRTPLTSIRGYLDLYREGGFRGGGELDDVIRRMSQESTRMHGLVEDLLLLAKLDEHRALRRETVDLGALLRDVATDARMLQPERRIDLDLGPVPVEAVGDAFRLQQVVGVLVNNALVHTDTDVSLRLSSRRSGDGAILEVADTGPGLSPTVAARVFDRFYRGDRSRARSTGGSGLGLAIAKSIVDAHGGTLTLVTTPGRGCSFRVQLPHPAGEEVTPSGPPKASGGADQPR